MIRFSLIWMVFMGIPMAFRQGAMVSVDVLHRWAGPRMKRVLDTVVMIASLTLVAVIIIVGWDYSLRGKVQTIIELEAYSMFWAYIAMPLGGAFSVLGIIGNFFNPVRMELKTAQWRGDVGHDGAVLCAHHLDGCLHRIGAIFGIYVGNVNMLVSVKKMFSSINKFPLAAIPFFILAGNLMETGGI